MRSAALALALVGCVGAGKQAAGEACGLNSECAAPLVCRLTRCRTECFETRDCPLGAGCVADEEGFGVCLLVDETECAQDGDCLPHLVCLDAQCVNECAEDRDCPPGTVCREGGCEDPGRAMRCVYDEQCLAPFVCDPAAGVCRAECVGDRDCLELVGTTCQTETVEGRSAGRCRFAAP